MGLLVHRCRTTLVALVVALATVAAPVVSAQAHAHHHAHIYHGANHRGHAAKTHRHGERIHVRAGSDRTAPAAGRYSSPDAAVCAQDSPTQTFLSGGDFNYYASAPGPAGTGFDGSTWSLSGGATAANGMLDLPAGSQAVSPDICITSQDPEARMSLRSVNGGDNVQVSVSHYTSAGWSDPQGAGGVNGKGTSWTLSNTIKLPPSPGSGPVSPSDNGWQIIRFTLTPSGGHSEFQLAHLGIAVPPPTPSTGPCSTPVMSQAFLPAGDANYYTPAPGQTGGGFVGTGWTLTGGAKIVTSARADGTTGMVLDLPAGSMAVSPNMCVTSLYPTARMMVRSVFGHDDLSFRVSYGGTNTWTNPHETGHVHGRDTNWTLSDPVQLQPSKVSGWQVLRVTLVPNGGHSEFQLYDLELDPYARG